MDRILTVKYLLLLAGGLLCGVAAPARTQGVGDLVVLRWRGRPWPRGYGRDGAEEVMQVLEACGALNLPLTRASVHWAP